MSASVGRLRLGPLPKTETVKLTITMSIELKAMLDRYADLHAQAWSEPVDAQTLIPHMLAAFMERDRGFKALRSKPGRPVTSPQPAAASSTAQMR